MMRCISLILGASLALAGEANLLRNGSFEGGGRYWYGLDGGHRQVADGGSAGRSRLHLEDGFVWSGCFILEPGVRATLSADLRAAAAGAKVHFYLVPSSRESGAEPFRLFWGASGVGRQVAETSWTRATWSIAIPGKDFAWRDGSQWWDRASWMLVIAGDHLDVDAVSLTSDGGGAAGYVGESPVETAVRATLPGDAMRHWNLADAGQAVPMTTSLHNPGGTPLAVRWRHSLQDYTGTRQIAEMPGGSATLAPGETRQVAWTATLPARGLMLARTVVSSADGRELGRSDQPLTVLPFPKAPTVPDPRERFGYSLCDVGKPPWTHIYDALARTGFAWSRWHPHTGWNSVQPDGPEQWNWPDAILDELARRGCSYNITLNGVPGWAKGGGVLPKDMEWKADDPRWQDLSIMTGWDRYLDAAARRWGGGKRSVVWEIINEPLWEHWDAAVYTRFIERSARRIRAVDAKARIMVNGCYGVDELHRGFIANGGAKLIDLFSFHNYGASGWFTTGDAVRGMRQAFAAGGKEPEVWFNEGWTHWPSSDDTRAWTVFARRGPVQLAHEAVCSTADAISGGLKQIILFNTAHNGPGRSWWDYSGDGNSLWDEGGQATVAVGMFNVLADQLGLAEPVGVVRSAKAQFHVFDDRRNRRGVAVVWADEAGAEYALKAAGLQRMDIMGGSEALPQRDGAAVLAFAEAKRPWYVFKPGLPARDLLELFKPFEQPNVVLGEGAYGLPTDWLARGAQGNPYVHAGRPIWRLGRVWPPQLDRAAAYRDLLQFVPADGRWIDPQDSQGGHPGGNLAGGMALSTVAPWQGGDGTKPASLAFVAPAAARYELDAIVRSERWTGGGQAWLAPVLLDRAAGTAVPQPRIDLADRTDTPVHCAVRLAAGQELVLVYGLDGMFTGAACAIRDLRVHAAVGGIDQNRPAHGSTP